MYWDRYTFRLWDGLGWFWPDGGRLQCGACYRDFSCFLNHIAVKKLNTDPTPLEVEMRLYEENICKTLIDQKGRKEKEIDVD